MNKDEIIGIKKAAEISGVTARGLRFACMRGDVPGAQKSGRDWLIPLEGLEYFLLHRRKGRKPRKVDKVGGGVVK
ncbi:MAG: hypothetical protein ACOY4M_08420 [Pseudomonadota bacterium]